MKNSSFLWQLSGGLQELANQLEIAKNEQNWQKVARISQLLVEKAKKCEKKGEEFWEKQD